MASCNRLIRVIQGGIACTHPSKGTEYVAQLYQRGGGPSTCQVLRSEDKTKLQAVFSVSPLLKRVPDHMRRWLRSPGHYCLWRKILLRPLSGLQSAQELDLQIRTVFASQPGGCNHGRTMSLGGAIMGESQTVGLVRTRGEVSLRCIACMAPVKRNSKLSRRQVSQRRPRQLSAQQHMLAASAARALCLASCISALARLDDSR